MTIPAIPGSAVTAVDLGRSFGSHRAVDGVSFEVPAGTVLGLLGPNGAGKTTVVRLLSTILAPTSGRATVLGYDISTQPEQVRLRIGLAGQYATVDDVLTARENLTMVGRLSHLGARGAAARCDELLERFRLADAADRPLRTFSGGMRRRIDLAAALVRRPPLVFLDEPTTGLDPQSRLDLWVVVEELVSEGTTVVLTTQYLEEADRLADQIVVIDTGTVVASGTASELKQRIGTTVLELGFADRDSAARARQVLAEQFSAVATEMPTTVACAGDASPQMVRAVLDVLGRGRYRVDLDRRATPIARRCVPATHEPANQLDRQLLARCSMTITTFTMNTTDTRICVDETPTRPAIYELVGDVRALAARNLIRLRRDPQLIVLATVQPVLFVLMFRYVFGGAIHVPGMRYVDFLMPGIWVLTVVMGALQTAVGIAEDLQNGLIERLRSLPMNRAAMLIGRTTSDMVRNVVVVSLMTCVGFVVGFRLHTNVAEMVAAFVLLLAFAYALSWLFVLLGLLCGNAETAQALSFPIMAVLVFASGSFVPVSTMPGWMQGFARNQPVTAVVNGLRSLVLGGAATHNLMVAVSWVIGMIAITAPLAAHRYRTR